MWSRPNHKSFLAAIIKNPTDHSDDGTLAAIVKRFWEIKDIGSENPSIIKKSFTRLGNGQYAVRLLSTSGYESLRASYFLTRRRFKSLEAKLDRNPTLKAQYSAFLKE